MTSGRQLGGAISFLLLVSCVGGAAGAEDSLLYFVDSGKVVFTNTPSRGDARPVPGFAADESQPEPGESSGTRLRATIYDGLIERIARDRGLPPRLIKAVAAVESDFDPHAVSSKGARGLMQLMPQTARSYGVNDAFDPVQNLRAGATHLRHLLDEFDGNLSLALAAYNAGAGAVRRHGGVPDYPETREYVRRVRERLGQRPRSRPAAGTPTTVPDVRMQRRGDGTIALVN